MRGRVLRVGVPAPWPLSLPGPDSQSCPACSLTGRGAAATARFSRRNVRPAARSAPRTQGGRLCPRRGRRQHRSTPSSAHFCINGSSMLQMAAVTGAAGLPAAWQRRSSSCICGPKSSSSYTIGTHPSPYSTVRAMPRGPGLRSRSAGAAAAAASARSGSGRSQRTRHGTSHLPQPRWPSSPAPSPAAPGGAFPG
jgi:hypothetical protein